MIILTRYLDCGVIFAISLLILAPVSANIDTTRGITSLFIIEKDGRAYTGDINYTISCSMNRSEIPASYKLFKPTENSNPWRSFFSLSGNCSTGNCPPIARMSWYTKGEEEPRFICQLNALLGNESFTVWNETEPGRYNLTDFYDAVIVVKKKAGYYNITPEFVDCNRIVMQSIHYRQYSCQAYLENYTLDYQEGKLAQTPCAEIYNLEVMKCYQYIEKVDLSWTNNEPATYIYKFNLSSANQNMKHPLRVRYIPQSPVESLYCSLVVFFGYEC